MPDADMSPSAARNVARWRSWLRPMLIGGAAVALNVLAYYLIPADFAKRFSAFGYLGIFVVTFVANATIIVPVPYLGVVARLAQSLGFGGVILAGALGSALGESVAFFVGRAGRETVNDTRFFRWVQRQMRHPWRAFLALFLLAAPLNPAFDVAGITAGAMGVPYPLFLTAVFLGRIIRMALIVFGSELLASALLRAL